MTVTVTGYRRRHHRASDATMPADEHEPVARVPAPRLSAAACATMVSRLNPMKHQVADPRRTPDEPGIPAPQPLHSVSVVALRTLTFVPLPVGVRVDP